MHSYALKSIVHHMAENRFKPHLEGKGVSDPDPSESKAVYSDKVFF